MSNFLIYSVAFFIAVVAVSASYALAAFGEPTSQWLWCNTLGCV